MSVKVQHGPPEKLSWELSLAAATMINAVWPKDDVSLEDYARILRNERPHPYVQDVPEAKRIVFWEEEAGSVRVLAHAYSFARVVTCLANSQSYRLLALASVCVSPEARGRGLGRDAVQEVFKRVSTEDFHGSLFQTGIPAFYEKLGAKQVRHEWINTVPVASERYAKWWEPAIMIWPATAAWPHDGTTLDLNGPAF